MTLPSRPPQATDALIMASEPP
ncbi:MAG: hypothetical protein RL385_5338, partial [Pseudomonadota bacterium]